MLPFSFPSDGKEVISINLLCGIWYCSASKKASSVSTIKLSGSIICGYSASCFPAFQAPLSSRCDINKSNKLNGVSELLYISTYSACSESG